MRNKETRIVSLGRLCVFQSALTPLTDSAKSNFGSCFKQHASKWVALRESVELRHLQLVQLGVAVSNQCSVLYGDVAYNDRPDVVISISILSVLIYYSV